MQNVIYMLCNLWRNVYIGNARCIKDRGPDSLFYYHSFMPCWKHKGPKNEGDLAPGEFPPLRGNPRVIRRWFNGSTSPSPHRIWQGPGDCCGEKSTEKHLYTLTSPGNENSPLWLGSSWAPGQPKNAELPQHLKGMAWLQCRIIWTVKSWSW